MNVAFLYLYVSFLVLSLGGAELNQFQLPQADESFLLNLPPETWRSNQVLHNTLEGLRSSGISFWYSLGNHSYIASFKSPEILKKTHQWRRLEQSSGGDLKEHLTKHTHHQKLSPRLFQPTLKKDGGGEFSDFRHQISSPVGKDPHHPWSLIWTTLIPPRKKFQNFLRDQLKVHLQTLNQLEENHLTASTPHTTIVYPASSSLRVWDVAVRLAKEPSTLWVDELPKPQVRNKEATKLTILGGGGGGREQIYERFLPKRAGQGEIITVADTGLDLNHCFFASPKAPPKLVLKSSDFYVAIPPPTKDMKVVAYVAVEVWVGPLKYQTDFEDQPNGHGTHVIGIAAGGLAKEYDHCQGKAKREDRSDSRAGVIVFDLENPRVSKKYLILPPSILPMMRTGYRAGSRIFSFSWGANTPEYTFQAREIDMFTYQNDDAVVVVAGGNEGSWNTLYTVGSPATAKNILSVGASLNTLKSWQEAEARFWRTRNNPVDRAHLATHSHLYQEEWLADFSSRGPTADNRTRPNLVGPGRMILSSRAKGENSSDLLLSQGTSQVAPLLAKLVVFTRSILIHRYHLPKPSSALIRGIFFTFAKRLTKGVAMLAFKKSSPGKARNYALKNSLTQWDEGFGRVFLLPFLQGNAGWLDREVLYSLSPPRKYCFKATQAGRFRITLTWTDPPGFVSTGHGLRALQNDLDLRVLIWTPPHNPHDQEDPDSVILGNMKRIPDRRNTEERVEGTLQGGEILRVIISAAGPIVTPVELRQRVEDMGRQKFSLVWTSTTLSSPGKCSLECTHWDPEFECVDREGNLGVRPCQEDTLTYEESPCLPGRGRGGELLCPPGTLRHVDGSCRCHAHIPCGEDSESVDSHTHHFSLCQPDGNLTSCMRLGSVFSPVQNVVRSTGGGGGGGQQGWDQIDWWWWLIGGAIIVVGVGLIVSAVTYLAGEQLKRERVSWYQARNKKDEFQKREERKKEEREGRLIRRKV